MPGAGWILALSPQALHRRLLADGLEVVPVNAAIAIRAAELGGQGFGRDPADRIIAATALVAGYRLATADARIREWAGQTGMLATFDPTD